LEIVIIGLSHKTAPLDLRERLAGCFNRNGKPVSFLLGLTGLKESLLITTCNRVEVLLTSEDPDQTVREMIKRWALDLQESLSNLKAGVYIFRSEEAVRHLFRVAASLDSLVVGEPQILGQIKEAYRQAAYNHTTGVILNRLLHKTFSVAKRIRTETGIASHAVSIAFAAVELAKKIFQDLAGKKVLLIGAGEMAELAAEHLLHNRVKKIIIANRTLERAMDLARKWHGQVISLEEISSALAEADIVISSTGAPEVIIHHPQVKTIMKQRKQRPLFFIDIAVPRDIDPRINELDNVFLYDMEDLQDIVDRNLAERKQEALQAERIIQEESIKFRSWLEGLEVVPTIISLREKIEGVLRREWKKAGVDHLGLTPEQQRAIEIMTNSIVNKVLHHPIIFLKEAGHVDHKAEKIDQIQKIFRLEKETGKEKNDGGPAGEGPPGGQEEEALFMEKEKRTRP
jgi:glutamyl-tRNA reductase